MKKIIHRIFFNFDNGPDPFLSYLETWKKQLPDFEIMFWDKNNLPLDLNAYTSYMTKTKNHAYLSDYFRCWLLEKYGGVYLDADIEILDGNVFRNIYEEAQKTEEYTLFIGIESERDGDLTAHSMGVKCGTTHEVLSFLMNLYETAFSTPLRYVIKKFPIPDLVNLYLRSLEETDNCSLSIEGHFRGKQNPMIINKIKIYPQDYFSPLSNYNNEMMVSVFSTNTCLCHHFAASWRDADQNNINGKLFSDLLKENYYTIPPDIFPRIKERYGELKIFPRRPLWALSENEVLQFERITNKIIPYGGIVYKLLRKLRKH
ncbi:glycosyltransferase family 32 protein [Treponema primitia]|uniref:glycosyltransferase family 32 protein n=1 Tax=Treponema primitia TaxID=88058 RepID=UPI000255569B|nr:glycosyltransferase [Treponema primitia]